MNKDKIIKDLKERNDSLNNQYRLRDIRCVCLENKVQEQEKEIERLKAREKECIEHYQVALKYANEMEERTIKAMHFVDQVLGYHLNSGYEQLDKDVNELYGILMGVDSDESKVIK